jgi:hypothetical protein
MFLGNMHESLRKLAQSGEYINLIPAVRSRLKNLQSAGAIAAIDEYFANLFSSENLDLSILNKNKSSEIFTKFKTNVLGINDLSLKAGLPGTSYRSENLYQHLTRYEVDLLTPLRGGKQIHPFLHSILGANFNLKEFPLGVEDISVGRNRIRNAMSSENLVNRLSKIESVGEGTSQRFVNYLGFDKTEDAGKIKTVLTWDTETTGLTAEAKVRSVSLVKRRVRVMPDGTTELVDAPTVVMTKHFKAEGMDIAHVYENGRPVPLSERNIKSRNGRNRSQL